MTTARFPSPVVDALELAADPALARAVIDRVLEADPDVASLLTDHRQLRAGVIAIACASRSLSGAIVNDPSLLEVLLDDESFRTERTVAGTRASFESYALATDGLGLSATALRSWKRREYLRISARDLLGVATLPVVGRELAALAQVCLTFALELAAPSAPFAVIGMGKLGGGELNYASDVDVIFVHDGEANEADRVARSLLATMTTPTAEGIVFRTDADLRPEGRAGALSRTIDSYGAWYERWARQWEYQSLIKARPVAGDVALGARFIEITQPFVWPEALDPDAIREVRAMKARSEAELARRGLTDRELKRGRGGIRDIEFAVQLLQLVHGRHDTSIRSPTTLNALEQLATGGYIGADDATYLGEAYTFLRTVEHRLQLWDEQQTHTLPADTPTRTRLARVLGYRDHADATALQQFEVDQRSHQGAVRSIHERLFFAPLLDTLAGAGALSAEATEERLAAFGFADATHTRAALRELTRGLTRSSRLMQQLLPVVLDWLSATPDPDMGLLQLRRLADDPVRARALGATLRETPGGAERLCRVLGSSRVAGDALLRQPEFIDVLSDDEQLAHERTRAELMDAALDTLRWRTDPDERRAGLRRFKRRELLRIMSRDLIGFASIEVTERALADLADACIEAALRAIDPQVPFAMIGMGRLGGRELSYSSDIDVLFVYDGQRPSDFDVAERAAAQLVQELGATTAEGQTFRVDANLRPEGKGGPLARSLDGYRAYYEQWALVWELQSLLRARPVGGDAAVGREFMEMVEPFVYRPKLPAEDIREIRRIKARVERERIPPGEDPQFHLKLGKGTLTDIEFTVQLLQLRHGGALPGLRAPATTEALAALRHAGKLEPDDANVLDEAYQFCARARNARYLVTGITGDALPTGLDAARVARLLGYVHSPEAELRDHYRRVTRRARRVVERIFYGRE